jgi:hypothetical protein
VKQEFDINERHVWSAATLVEVDEAYTRWVDEDILVNLIS